MLSNLVSCSFDQFVAIKSSLPLSSCPAVSDVHGSTEAPDTYWMETHWFERLPERAEGDGERIEVQAEPGRVILRAVRVADLLPAAPGSTRREAIDDTIRLSWWVDQAVLAELYAATPMSA